MFLHIYSTYFPYANTSFYIILYIRLNITCLAFCQMLLYVYSTHLFGGFMFISFINYLLSFFSIGTQNGYFINYRRKSNSRSDNIESRYMINNYSRLKIDKEVTESPDFYDLDYLKYKSKRNDRNISKAKLKWID